MRFRTAAIAVAFLLVATSQLAGQTDIAATRQATENLLNQGRNEEAIHTAQKALKIVQDDPLAHGPRLADLQFWLGELYLRLGRFQDAETALREALALRQRHHGKEAVPTADVHASLAKLYLESGLGDLAEKELQSAMRIYKVCGLSCLQQYTAMKEQHAGLCLMNGRLSEAEQLYDTVLILQVAQWGDQNPELAQVLNNLGGVYLAQGRQERAQGVYEQALNLQQAAYGPDGLPLATTYTNLGVMHDQVIAFELAEKNLLRAYEIRGKHLKLADPLVLVSLDNLVSFYLKRDDYTKAEGLLLEAKQMRERKLGADQPAVAEILDRFATLSMARGQADLAERYWLMALQIRENSLGPQHELVAANLYNLGKLENILHKNDQARIHLNWALDNYEGQTMGNEAQVTAVLSELFLCDYMQGKLEAADQQLALMRTIKTEVYGPAHPETLAVMEEQVKFYRDTEQDARAEEVEAALLTLRRRK